MTARPLNAPRRRVGAGLLQAGEALRVLAPPYYLVHDSTFTYSDEYEGSWPATFVYVDGVNASLPVPRPVLIHAYKLLWDVTVPLSDSAAVARVWPRGKTSSGWRRIDETTDYWYDGLFYANHADMAWHGGSSFTFSSYTYKVYSGDGDTLIGWFPIDLDDPGTPLPKLTYSYIVDATGASAPGDRSHDAGRAPSVRTWSADQHVVFEITTTYASTPAVAIFDVAGRELRSLTGPAPAGSGLHRIHWDRRDAGGRPVPSGVYFAKIWESSTRGRSSRQTTRIVIVR